MQTAWDNDIYLLLESSEALYPKKITVTGNHHFQQSGCSWASGKMNKCWYKYSGTNPNCRIYSEKMPCVKQKQTNAFKLALVLSNMKLPDKDCLLSFRGFWQPCSLDYLLKCKWHLAVFQLAIFKAKRLSFILISYYRTTLRSLKNPVFLQLGGQRRTVGMETKSVCCHQHPDRPSSHHMYLLMPLQPANSLARSYILW